VTEVEQRSVILLCTLDRPDAKVMPLLFAAAAARSQGARLVGLVAPYLAYMRQDKAFQLGEAVTSATFAEILSTHFDWLVTLDPHLHRYAALSEIYSVPAISASAAQAIGNWVRREVEQPIVIGPDEESRQWVERIGEVASAEVAVLRKTRNGDFSVSIDETALGHLKSGIAVVVDDIASSARTMIETVRSLKQRGRPSPVCVVVHPIFAVGAYEQLLEAGPARVISTNSIPHGSNAIDISGALAQAVTKALSRDPLSIR
jgi:ribose-phosphate pyrophosphokinase